jgi:hypothetical protein
MQPLNLYQIDQDLQLIEAALVEANGEIDDDLDQRYNALLDSRDDKHRSYVAVIRRLEASAAAVKEERQRLQDNERALTASAKRLKDRLCASMIAAGEDLVETPLGKLRVQTASSAPLELLVEPEQLPEHFRRVSISADVAALKHAIEEGDAGALSFARIGEPSKYVRIY